MSNCRVSAIIDVIMVVTIIAIVVAIAAVAIVAYSCCPIPDKRIIGRQWRCVVYLQLARCQLHREEDRQDKFSEDCPTL